MKNNQYFLNPLLAIVVFAACAIALLVRVWLPAAIIPELNIPNMVALSVIALLLEHFLVKTNPRCYICIPLLAVLTFGETVFFVEQCHLEEGVVDLFLACFLFVGEDAAHGAFEHHVYAQSGHLGPVVWAGGVAEEAAAHVLARRGSKKSVH